MAPAFHVTLSVIPKCGSPAAPAWIAWWGRGGSWKSPVAFLKCPAAALVTKGLSALSPRHSHKQELRLCIWKASQVLCSEQGEG